VKDIGKDVSEPASADAAPRGKAGTDMAAPQTEEMKTGELQKGNGPQNPDKTDSDG
jgi:hypothetical protein